MLIIRDGQNSDLETIYRYIIALAEEEAFPYPLNVKKDKLAKNLFSENSIGQCLVLECEGQVCGFAVYYYTISTTQGKKGLHLDDFYIEPSFRRRGCGREVMVYLANLARENDCTRFEWWVLKNNRSAINFYHSLGADDLTELSVFRLDEEMISLLVK